ncbi:MAG: hypothetical protein JWN52_5989 [Actinomycetia bacterium]|nr:hypothetical protein [Actinomycetes bacterium]
MRRSVLNPEDTQEALAAAYLSDWFTDEPHEHARLDTALPQLRHAHRLTLRQARATVQAVRLQVGAEARQAQESIIAKLGGPVG